MVTERKGEPFSIRLAESTERLVEAEARRTKRSKSAIVESLTEEAARVRRFPGVGFHGDDVGRAAWVIGTGLDVWEIVQMVEDLGSLDAVVKESHLTQRQVELALAYRSEYAAEVGAAVEENRRPVEEWNSLYPFVQPAVATP